MSEPADWDDMVLVGRVARVHGLRGEVIVNPETDFPEERFEPGRVVYCERRGVIEPLRVATCRLQRGRPVVGFAGIERIEEAEAFAGLELRVPAEWLPKLPPGSYYLHDLVGCEVQTASGETLGTVARVDGDGGAARLVIDAAQGEVLVPLALDICREIDPAGKRIVVEPPEGLLELNVARPRGDAQTHRGTRMWRARRGRV